MRRGITIRFPCAHGGCDDVSYYKFASNAEYLRSHEFREYGSGKKPYTCAKHSPRHVLLSTSILISEWTSPPSLPHKGCEASYRSFGNAGILFGPGFCADPKDFPDGTRIKVTAEVILP